MEPLKDTQASDDELVTKYNKLYMTCVIELKLQFYIQAALFLVYSVIFLIIIFKYGDYFNKARRIFYIFELDMAVCLITLMALSFYDRDLMNDEMAKTIQNSVQKLNMIFIITVMHKTLFNLTRCEIAVNPKF